MSSFTSSRSPSAARRSLFAGSLLALLPLAAGCLNLAHEPLSMDLTGFEFDRARIINSSGYVNVVPGDGWALDAELTWSGGRRPEVKVDVVSGELRVEYDCPPGLGSCAVDMDLVLPPGLELDVDVSSGEVEIDGMGAAHVVASSGSITVTDALGDLDLRASSGRVVVDGAAGDVVIEASSGPVEARVVAGDLTVDASSGQVLINGVGGDLSVDASSGSVDANFLTGKKALIEASSGRIAVSFDSVPTLVDLDASSGDIELRVPTGAYRVDADANSGDVEVVNIIQDPNAPNALNAHASSGDVLIVGL